MTVLHKSSVALRRMSIVKRYSKRDYSHASQPLYRTAAPNGSTSPTQQNKAAGWLVPAAIALFGLGFSTFSTHRLMSCPGANVVIGKK